MLCSSNHLLDIFLELENEYMVAFNLLRHNAKR